MISARNKHIDTWLHFLREKVTMQQLTVTHLAGKPMPPDALTKPVAEDKLAFYKMSWGLC